jgi:uncharacterized protein YggE
MKIRMCLLFILSLIAVTASAESSKPGTITVFGSAETYILPDRVDWILAITTHDRESEKAAAAADAILQDVMETGASLGLTDNEMIIGKVIIAKRYAMEDADPLPKFAYYEVRQHLRFVESDVSSFSLFSRAFMNVSGLDASSSFIAASVDSVRNEMRVEALEDAKNKASELAGVVGASVGHAISISEFKPDMKNYEIESTLRQRSVVYTPRPEEIKIEAIVYVVFELLYD